MAPAGRSGAAGMVGVAGRVVLLLALSRGVAGTDQHIFRDYSQGLLFRDRAANVQMWTPCDVGTPPDGFVFPMTCTTPNLATPTAISCATVSFHVLANKSNTEQIIFEAPLPSDRFEVTGSCVEPTAMCGMNYNARCGAEDASRENDFPLIHETDCGTPVCQDKGCTCSNPAKKCTCFWGQRYTVRAKSMVGLTAGETGISSAKLCFKAKLWDGGEARRCVYIDVMVQPDALYVSTSLLAADKTTSVDIVVGYPLLLSVFAHDHNMYQSVTIEMRRKYGDGNVPTVELPNQEWAGPTVCVNGVAGQTSANMSTICPGGLWRRTIKYTARHSEAGLSYDLFVMATDSGLTQATLNGGLVTAGAQPGGTCAQSSTLCSAGAKAISFETRSIRVNVVQVAPAFVLEDNAENKDIFAEQNRQEYRPLLSTKIHLGTPEADVELPKAYVNCPMTSFGIFAYKANAVVGIEVEGGGGGGGGGGYGNAVEQGLRTSDRVFYPKTYSASNLDGEFYSYMGVEWLPRLGAEGTTYRICARAFDSFSEARRCWVIEVVRCMYCTTGDDRESIQSVAARFSSNWLQLWAANGPEWVKADQDSLAASKVTAWSQTENPNYIQQGALLKLGPVYVTRQDQALEDLAARFHTTVKSLLAANPDIRAMGGDKPVPAGQPVCVLPGICTASAA